MYLGDLRIFNPVMGAGSHTCVKLSRLGVSVTACRCHSSVGTDSRIHVKLLATSSSWQAVVRRDPSYNKLYKDMHRMGPDTVRTDQHSGSRLFRRP